MDHEQTAQFRGAAGSGNQLAEATSLEHLQNIQGLFRDELRKYQDSTPEQLRRLRKKMGAALDEFAGC